MPAKKKQNPTPTKRQKTPTTQAHPLIETLCKQTKVIQVEPNTAYLLQTLLSGSEETLRELLQSWEQSAQPLVKAMVGGSLTKLTQQLTKFSQMGLQWTYPWLLACAKKGQSISDLSVNVQEGELETALRVKGKLQLLLH